MPVCPFKPVCQRQVQPLRSCRPQDGQIRRPFFQPRRLFWMPERVISRATQKVEAKRASTWGPSDMAPYFSTVFSPLKPRAVARAGER